MVGAQVHAKSGWADAGGQKYYANADGTIVREQWLDVGGGRYYFRPSGAMATGWATIDGNKHWFRPSGNMAVGWADVDDAYKRYFDAEGHMVTGWQGIGANTYYFRPSGAMQTGVAEIDGKTYTFSDKGVLVNVPREVSTTKLKVTIGDYVGTYDGGPHAPTVTCEGRNIYYRTDKPFLYDLEMIETLNKIRLGRDSGLSQQAPPFVGPGTQEVYFLVVPNEVNMQDILLINKYRLGQTDDLTDCSVLVGSAMVELLG